MMLKVLSLVFVLVAFYVAYVINIKGSADLPSYLIARGTYNLFPKTFPRNNSHSAQQWRRGLTAVSSIRFSSLPDIESVDVNTEVFEGNPSRVIRIYNGSANAPTQLRDVLVFYFGGGFVLGGLNDNEKLCRSLALHTGFVVVAVEYGLAPEFPFPHGFNDALFGLRWVKQHIATHGGNPERVFISGESAGGNLAAAVTAANLDSEVTSAAQQVNVLGLVLIYPGLAFNFTSESFSKYATFNGILTKDVVQHARGLYRAGQEIASTDYRFQPLRTPPSLLAQFPPTEIIYAEFDVLRDDSILFAQKLNEAKPFNAHTTYYPTTIHGFFGRDLFPQGKPSMLKMCAQLKSWTGNAL
jgi:acetyl esterase